MTSPVSVYASSTARAEREVRPTQPALPEPDRFAVAFAVVLGHESGYTADPADPGNWTGGAPGRGECRGTNWGISAASYPDLPIRALTPDQARAIYRRDYWDRVRGDRLPPPLALLVFDAAVNCGVGRAGRWLQGVLGVAQDGAVGEVTLAALRRRVERERSYGRDQVSPEDVQVRSDSPPSRDGDGRDPIDAAPSGERPHPTIEAGVATLCAEFQAARLLYMVSLQTWQRFGGGWAKRLCRLPFEALRMETP